MVGDHIGAVTGFDDREVDGGFLFFIAEFAQLQDLVRGFHGGVAAQFRGDTSMSGFAFDFDHGGGAAFAPYHQAVGGAAGFEVEGDVVAFGGVADQLGGGLGAGFFAGVE